MSDPQNNTDDALEALKHELQVFKDLAARAQADLQNAKARIDRESEELRQFATASLILKLLPTLDNFQRAFLHIPEDLKNHEWVKGIAAIEQDLMKQIAEVGLKRMNPLGELSDPNRHEILAVGEGEEGKIIEVLEEGYEMQGKILRPAKVKVGGGK